MYVHGEWTPGEFQEGIMSASKSAKKNNRTNPTTQKVSDDQYVDVLYQKLGENWFAFSLIDDEVFMAPISEDQISEIRNSKPGTDHEA